MVLQWIIPARRTKKQVARAIRILFGSDGSEDVLVPKQD